MDRRALLKSGGLAAAGFTLDACAPKGVKPQVAPRPTRPPVVLAPVQASWDRIIRTTVGLRPHSPTGFVLRADKLDEDADPQLRARRRGHVAVVGNRRDGRGARPRRTATAARRCSAAAWSGLTTARELQRHGFDVTIYAAAVPPDTTSNMSLAGFTPTSGLVELRPPRRRSGTSSSARAVRIALSAAAAAGRPAGTASPGSQLRAHRRRAGGVRAQRADCPQTWPSARGPAAAGRAPVSDDVRVRPRRDAHRAVDLPRGPGERLRAVRGHGRDPQVRDAPRRGGADRIADRQLHRTGLEGAVR